MTKILITGGSGLVGSRLSERLAAQNHEVIHLSRNPGRNNTGFPTYKWEIATGYIEAEALHDVEVMIHLAGSTVGTRWSTRAKKEIRDSRVQASQLLFHHVKENRIPLKHFISASAIGYYGLDTGSNWLSEEQAPGNDFLAKVVKDWENCADRFEKELAVPVTKIRIGIVFSRDGGALHEMAKPIRMGFGAPVGSGNQYISWIYEEDLVDIFVHCLEKRCLGTFNAVGPDPITNKNLTKLIAKTLKRPLVFPNIPGFMLKLIFGQMAEILLGGNRVSNQKILETDYHFSVTDPEEAVIRSFNP